MSKEERSPAPNGGRRIEDHFVTLTEMVRSGTMPENLSIAESMKKRESWGRKEAKALERRPSEPGITGDSQKEWSVQLACSSKYACSIHVR